MTGTLLHATNVDPNLVAGYDVGGTKVDVRVFSQATAATVLQRRYPTCDFPSLDALLDQSLVDLGARPARIVMAIAGPRRANGDVLLTNQSAWPLFRVAETAQRLGIAIETVNDMVGTAAGLGALVITKQRLKAGSRDPQGPQLVISWSTGVGDALLLPNGTPVPAEGGHVTWQPMSDLEYRYLQFLRSRYGHDSVSLEVAVSGSAGFGNLYEFLTEEMEFFVAPRVREEVESYRQSGQGIGPVITRNAVSHRSTFCSRLMEVLGSILGQHARNRALGTLSTGGVFFSGTIIQSPGVADFLVEFTPFLKRFISPGAQHDDLMRATPIYLVTDPAVAVIGALELALRAN